MDKWNFLCKLESKLDSHIGLGKTLAPKEEASKVSFQGRAHA